MIDISVVSNEHNEIASVHITGHAGYAEYGSDIVCAAVSNQAISVVNSIEFLLNVALLVEVDEVEGGDLLIKVPEQCDSFEQVQLLLRHLAYSLEVIAQEYPDYVTFNLQVIK